jgi:hypothetical protein
VIEGTSAQSSLVRSDPAPSAASSAGRSGNFSARRTSGRSTANIADRPAAQRVAEFFRANQVPVSSNPTRQADRPAAAPNRKPCIRTGTHHPAARNPNRESRASLSDVGLRLRIAVSRVACRSQRRTEGTQARGKACCVRAPVVLAQRSASNRLQRRPVALRAIFNAHGPIRTVSRTEPREWTAKIGVGVMPTRVATT